MTTMYVAMFRRSAAAPNPVPTDIADRLDAWLADDRSGPTAPVMNRDDVLTLMGRDPDEPGEWFCGRRLFATAEECHQAESHYGNFVRVGTVTWQAVAS